ncbi:glycine betaine uptake BCCT transporter [Candidatus Syntrophocurvum alkaliphilum]|nr:BCCT family transporter [Candidatus Syntrophocurvum alkaliphilum]
MFKNIVFRTSLFIILLIAAIGIYNPILLEEISTTIYTYIIEWFGWTYQLIVFLFLIFCIGLAFSKYGNVKLGKDHEKAQYSYFAWLSMLFAAGMGIGLIFWGVAEPLSHFMNPPDHIPNTSGDAAAFAMRYSFFHWGLQAWAIYIVMSLSLAYFTFRRDMPPLISSTFYPLLGDKIYGYPGHLINVLAIFATVFGVATSLGLGALQINSGLSMLYGIPDSIQFTIIIIGVLTILFLISGVIGLDKGMQIISKFNMLLALLLLLFIVIIGPTTYIFNVFISTLGEYTNRLLEMSLQTFPFQGYDWTQAWTMFYWAWWIAWSPFVGLFIARISRGRTIKEFILGALFVPTLITFIWFSVFGGTALNLELNKGIAIANAATNEASTALFIMFQQFPFSEILSIIAVILLVLFFITSADAATFVLGIMSSNGDMHPRPIKKLVWGLTQSILAAVLLISGGLVALQQMSIAAALPFSLIMVLMCYNLLVALYEEKNNPYL